MKSTRAIVTLLAISILISCAPVQEQETPTAVPPTAQPTAATLPTETATPPTPTPETAATDTAVPTITTPTDEPTATTLPTVTPTVQAAPFTEGKILFFWDTETPLEEPSYYSIPAGEPKQDLYVAIPGATPADWQIEPVLRQIMNWPSEAPNWPLVLLSPDKSKLVFTVQNDIDGNVGFDRNSVYLYDLAHGVVEQVIDDTHLGISGLAWWPDSETLAYSWGKEVFLAKLDGSPIEALAPPFETNVGVVASPDGTLLAIQLYDASSFSLLFFNRETGEFSSLIPSMDLGNSQNPLWSADSQWLVVHKHYRDGLLLLNTRTFETITLLESGFITTFAWSPPGLQLAFTQNTDTVSALFVWDSATLTTTHLVQRGPVGFSPPIWSPDGSQLGFSFLQNGTASLSAVEVATGTSRELLQMENLYGFEPFSWSPDGQWLLFFATEERGRSGLYIINQAGGEPHLILDTTGTLNPYRVMWLPAE
jgi:Tol biopolymer transport system component